MSETAGKPGRPRSIHTHCTRPGCTDKHYARGLCRRHHLKWTEAGKLARRIPTDTVVQHLAYLAENGVTRREIAAAAKVSLPTLRRLITGFSATIYTDTAARILAVQPGSVAKPPNAHVPVHGTRRRLQALSAMGWSCRAIAQHPEVMVKDFALTQIRGGEQAACSYAVARGVSAVYDRLWDKEGPSVQARNMALTNGWALPLEWDDIDNPDETPSGRRESFGQQKAKTLDRREQVAEWLDDPRPEWHKGNVPQLAERLGVTWRTIERDKAHIRRQRAARDAA